MPLLLSFGMIGPDNFYCRHNTLNSWASTGRNWRTDTVRLLQPTPHFTAVVPTKRQHFPSTAVHFWITLLSLWYRKNGRCTNQVDKNLTFVVHDLRLKMLEEGFRVVLTGHEWRPWLVLEVRQLLPVQRDASSRLSQQHIIQTVFTLFIHSQEIFVLFVWHYLF